MCCVCVVYGACSGDVVCVCGVQCGMGCGVWLTGFGVVDVSCHRC